MQGISRLVPRWLAVLLVAAWGLILACAVGGPPGPRAADVGTQSEVAAGIPLNEVLWIDRVPEKEKDAFKAYLFTDDNVGISIDGLSVFKLVIEIFEFKADKTKLSFHFPHDRRRASCPYTLEKLKKPTKYFDVQLTITNDPQNGGVTHDYFSGPDFRQGGQMPTLVRQGLDASGAAQYFEHADSNE
jgi:hypothetical protein